MIVAVDYDVAQELANIIGADCKTKNGSAPDYVTVDGVSYTPARGAGAAIEAPVEWRTRQRSGRRSSGTAATIRGTSGASTVRAPDASARPPRTNLSKSLTNLKNCDMLSVEHGSALAPGQR
jgi:hypothetical protein